jgi:hypothetical protein
VCACECRIDVRKAEASWDAQQLHMIHRSLHTNAVGHTFAKQDRECWPRESDLVGTTQVAGKSEADQECWTCQQAGLQHTIGATS